jgi:hypothetical protein
LSPTLSFVFTSTELQLYQMSAPPANQASLADIIDANPIILSGKKVERVSKRAITATKLVEDVEDVDHYIVRFENEQRTVVFNTLFAYAMDRLIARVSSAIMHLKDAKLEIFNYVRFRSRFSPAEKAAADAPQKQQDDSDFQLAVELCFNFVGFHIMRTFAIVEEYGDEELKKLGLMGIAMSETLLSKFIELLQTVFIDSQRFSAEKVPTLDNFKLEIRLQGEALAFFDAPNASARQSFYEADAELEKMKEYKYLIPKTSMNIEFLLREEEFISGLEWQRELVLARMIIQACRAAPRSQQIFDLPTVCEAENVGRLGSKFMELQGSVDERFRDTIPAYAPQRVTSKATVGRKSDVFDVFHSVQFKIIQSKVTEMTSEHIELMFEGFGAIYETMKKVSTAICTRKGNRSQIDQPTLFTRIANSSVIERTKFAEAVSIRRGIEKVVSVKSDSKQVIMRNMEQTLNLHLFSIVEALTK